MLSVSNLYILYVLNCFTSTAAAAVSAVSVRRIVITNNMIVECVQILIDRRSSVHLARAWDMCWRTIEVVSPNRDGQLILLSHYQPMAYYGGGCEYSVACEGGPSDFHSGEGGAVPEQANGQPTLRHFVFCPFVMSRCWWMGKRTDDSEKKNYKFLPLSRTSHIKWKMWLTQVPLHTDFDKCLRV